MLRPLITPSDSTLVAAARGQRHFVAR
jgi:hypothetical protein